MTVSKIFKIKEIKNEANMKNNLCLKYHLNINQNKYHNHNIKISKHTENTILHKQKNIHKSYYNA